MDHQQELVVFDINNSHEIKKDTVISKIPLNGDLFLQVKYSQDDIFKIFVNDNLVIDSTKENSYFISKQITQYSFYGNNYLSIEYDSGNDDQPISFFVTRNGFAIQNFNIKDSKGKKTLLFDI